MGAVVEPPVASFASPLGDAAVLPLFAGIGMNACLHCSPVIPRCNQDGVHAVQNTFVVGGTSVGSSSANKEASSIFSAIMRINIFNHHFCRSELGVDEIENAHGDFFAAGHFNQEL